MLQLDLFSGIGGFALAASWVWGDDHKIHSFVEIDPFCQKVLKKHWPNVPIHPDIRSYNHDGTAIDLLTGGFPCQPFSVAGRQRGKEDDRYLWTAMLKIISEVKPTWIIGENVAGIIKLELDNCISDLEAQAYEVQTFIIPACAVEAPHRRDRVWIVANSIHSADRTKRRKIRKEEGLSRINRKTLGFGMLTRTNNYVANPSSKRLERPKWEKQQRPRRRSSSQNRGQQNTWDKNWLKIATSLCGMDDGISRGLDRNNRLKALGNAIVPQVVVPIMEAIKELSQKVMAGRGVKYP